MYNTIEVVVMEIKKAEIAYFQKGGLNSDRIEGVRHVKILPYLSVVQSVEGNYDIALGSGSTLQTGEGGFFVAPSGVQQTIVHHTDPKSGRMICRWIFIDVEINRAYRLDDLYHFPTVLDETAQKEMNALFDRLFATEEVWETYSLCYQILGVLLRTAKPSRNDPNRGIHNAVDYIIENYTQKISLCDLARIANMSESNFYAAFRKRMGTSPIAYLNHYRLSLATDRLTATEDAVGEISYAVGIHDPLYFSKLFKKNYGMTPREYRLMHKKRFDTD